MNKREMIHALIDKILDIEETSKKGASFNYTSNLSFDFYFTSRPGNFSDRVGARTDLYLRESWDINEQYFKCLTAIEKMQNTPDVEPKISFELTEERARELGLITGAMSEKEIA